MRFTFIVISIQAIVAIVWIYLPNVVQRFTFFLSAMEDDDQKKAIIIYNTCNLLSINKHPYINDDERSIDRSISSRCYITIELDQKFRLRVHFFESILTKWISIFWYWYYVTNQSSSKQTNIYVLSEYWRMRCTLSLTHTCVRIVNTHVFSLFTFWLAFESLPFAGLCWFQYFVQSIWIAISNLWHLVFTYFFLLLLSNERTKNISNISFFLSIFKRIVEIRNRKQKQNSYVSTTCHFMF